MRKRSSSDRAANHRTAVAPLICLASRPIRNLGFLASLHPDPPLRSAHSKTTDAMSRQAQRFNRQREPIKKWRNYLKTKDGALTYSTTGKETASPSA
jgi:hypothetical protein